MDEPSQDSIRVAHMVGELQGLLSFAVAMARSHPDQDLIKKQLHAAFQAGLARLEMSVVPEYAVDGFLHVRDAVLGAVSADPAR